MLTRRLTLYVSLLCVLLLMTYSAQVIAIEQDTQSPDDWEILYADSQNVQTMDSVPAIVREAQLEEQFVFQYADYFFVNALNDVTVTVRNMALLLDWEFLYTDSFYVMPLSEIESGVRNAPLRDDFVIEFADSFTVHGLQPPIEGAGHITPTPTPIATDPSPDVTPPATATPSIADGHEPDNACSQATTIPTEGTHQNHNFHANSDEDWIQFTGTAGVQYRIIGEMALNSRADLMVEVRNACDGGIEVEQSHSFAPGVRITFQAETDGVYYIRVTNDDPGTFGADVSYSLSVRDMGTADQASNLGAVIIVAGRQRSGDILQRNIHHVTNNVYRLFHDEAYPDSRIHYLATDFTLDPIGDGGSYVDEAASSTNLEYAITTWAQTRVSENQALTLYLMSHGDEDQFYLDGSDTLSPEQLDSWLDTLEAAVPGLEINVIIEACHSGSFIELDGAVDTISQANRVVVASAAPQQLAWASPKGALFSDFFLFGLRQRYTVYHAFQMAFGAAEMAPWSQTPWLDDNGNSIPNERDEGAEAAVRGFQFAGTFGESWEPYIQQADARDVTETEVTLQARVFDDKNDEGETVWAVIYPPSYTPPDVNSVDFVTETVETIPLTSTGGGFYETTLSLAEVGRYEILFYALDEDDLLSRPRSIQFSNSNIPLHVTLNNMSVARSAAWVTIMTSLMIGSVTVINVRRQ